jgi:hypothetical protein
MAHNVPVSVGASRDPLGRMRVYQLASELVPDAFQDATALKAELITEKLAGQLY